MLSDECRSERFDSKQSSLAVVVCSGRCSIGGFILGSGTSLALDTIFSCNGRSLPRERQPMWPPALLRHWPAVYSCRRVRCTLRLGCRAAEFRVVFTDFACRPMDP